MQATPYPCHHHEAARAIRFAAYAAELFGRC